MAATSPALVERYLTDPRFHNLVHHMVNALAVTTYADLEDAITVAVRIIEEQAARMQAGQAAPPHSSRTCPTCQRDLPPDYAEYLRTFPLDDPRR